MNWKQVCERSKANNEKLDCAVKAVSIVTGVHYDDVHTMMQNRGRRHGGRTKHHITADVLKCLGAVMETVEVKSKTVKRLPRELKIGTYLVWTHGHILAVKDGTVMDWTAGRRHRIKKVMRIT